jgi:dTDP-4-amino-4,6-dideoxygalactose transaminase
MPGRIHLSPPDTGPLERRFVADAFDSNWIAPLGPQVDAFEAELAERCEVAAACATSSGTAALHLALILAGVGPGDEVLCPSLTFVASVNPVRYVGATPVLVDSDPGTWVIDPRLVEEELHRAAAVGRRPAALVAVDLYGQCADYGRLEALCEEYGVALIEDAAEALGSEAYERPAGSFGRFGVLSFNGNKIVTTSGGGALLSDDADAVRRARHLATQAREPAPHYEHTEIGFNYRLSNVSAAIGRGQLATLDDRVAARRRGFEAYRAALGGLAGVSFMPDAAYGLGNRWLAVLTIDPAIAGADREAVRMALETADIEARPVWKPMHLQPLYRDARVIGGDVAARLFDHGLCLPSGSSLSDEDRARVIDVVTSVLG